MTTPQRLSADIISLPDQELFGPANVGVWGASLAVDAGNAEEALRHAERLSPQQVRNHCCSRPG